MAESGGHWDTLTEVDKLSQSTLIPGVIEEDIKLNNPVELIPVSQATNTGLSITWRRESTTTEDDVADFAIGDQLALSESLKYTTEETALKRTYLMRKLDNFVSAIYGNVNNYRVQMLKEMQKGVLRNLGDKLIYDDITYGGANQFDGLHAKAALQTGTDLDIDAAEAGLSLTSMRVLLDSMLYGCDFFLFPIQIARRFDQAWQELGLTGLASGTAGALSSTSYGWNEAGKRIGFFDGIPIIRTHFLVAENQNVGDGSNLRAKYTANDRQYSVFAIKKGNVMAGEGGLSLGFGGTTGAGQFFRLDYIPVVKEYDAPIMRLINYSAPLLGSKLCLGRIFDIEDLAVVA